MEDVVKLKKAKYHLWAFTISKLVSSFGSLVYTFAISLYILQQTGSATSFAMNLICSILPRTLVAPFAGYLADNYSRKAIVVTAQIISTLAIGGLLIVSLNSGLSLVAIYTTTAIISASSQFSGVAMSSSITGLFDESKIQKAMSLNQMSTSIAAIGSPAVGGFLYGYIPMSAFLTIFMISAIIAVIFSSTMNFNLFATRKNKGEGAPKESIYQSIKMGITYLRSHPVIMVIIWISLFINFFFGAFMVGYSFTLIELIKMEPRHFGFTEAAFAVGMLLMSIWLSTQKELKYPLQIAKRGTIVISTIIGGIALPLIIDIPYGGMLVYYAILMFVFGLTQVLVNTPLQVMLQKLVEDEFKGRVFSIIETMGMALMPLGTVVYGYIYDIYPAEKVLLISSSLLVGVVLILARPSVIREAHPELKKKKMGNSKPSYNEV